MQALFRITVLTHYMNIFDTVKLVTDVAEVGKRSILSDGSGNAVDAFWLKIWMHLFLKQLKMPTDVNNDEG